MLAHKHRLAVFVSGRGSNCANLIDACADETFPARIELVICNRPKAPALTIAKRHHITTHVIPHDDYPDRRTHDDAIERVIKAHPHSIELICLAGYDRLFSGDFIRRIGIRMINIHPSLLPKHKGLNPHARVLASGDRFSGCTVHEVTAAMDDGAIILQKKLAIIRHGRNKDTVASLAERVLALEHQAYPQAIRQIYAVAKPQPRVA